MRTRRETSGHGLWGVVDQPSRRIVASIAARTKVSQEDPVWGGEG